MVEFRRGWLLAGVGLSLALGCSAPADEPEQEPIGSVESAASSLPINATFVMGSSTATRFRGKGAKYIACAGHPETVSYDYRNTGDVVLRDVEGQGDFAGSDVKLVTTSGKADPIARKKLKSVRDTKNRKVRHDRAASDCITHDGCRKTRFKFTRSFPTTPGVYTSRWRMRDFSDRWGATSQGFGEIAQLRFMVVDCNAFSCGCNVHCADTSKFETAADGYTCKSIAEAKCGGKAQLLHWSYTPCPGDPTPAGSGGEGGGGGSGGTGGGSGGTSSGGTSSGGTSSGGSGGVCSSCVLPGDLAEDGESCCTGDGKCGFTSDYLQGQCISLMSDEEEEELLNENGYTPSPGDPNDEPVDDPQYVDPDDAEEYRGEAIAESGGCSIAGRSRHAAAWLLGLIGFAVLGWRRFRRDS